MRFGPRLFRIRAKSRAPDERQAINCPYCGHRFDASGRAISLACPQCRRPLNLGPRNIEREATGHVTTVGPIRVARQGTITGQVLCTSLSNEGTLAGHVTVLGRAELHATSHTTGQIQARSLYAHPGATLQATAAIGPNPQPPISTSHASSAATPPPPTARPTAASPGADTNQTTAATSSNRSDNAKAAPRVVITATSHRTPRPFRPLV